MTPTPTEEMLDLMPVPNALFRGFGFRTSLLVLKLRPEPHTRCVQLELGRDFISPCLELRVTPLHPQTIFVSVMSRLTQPCADPPSVSSQFQSHLKGLNVSVNRRALTYH